MPVVILVAVAHSVQATPSVCACKYFLHQMHASILCLLRPDVAALLLSPAKKAVPELMLCCTAPCLPCVKQYRGACWCNRWGLLHRPLSCHSML